MISEKLKQKFVAREDTPTKDDIVWVQRNKSTSQLLLTREFEPKFRQTIRLIFDNNMSTIQKESTFINIG